jgi:hypothetical protein
MSLKASQLAAAMSAAAADSLGDKWPDIKDYAVGEFKKVAADIVLIGKLRTRKKISSRRAKLHLEMQKNATKTVLLTVEGLGILAVEAALNAALKAVRDVVNTAVGFSLLK